MLIILYFAIPDLFVGIVQFISALVPLKLATTNDGASTGVAGFVEINGDPITAPLEFNAFTVNVYEVPFISPVYRRDVVPAFNVF
jgi:hypothetical protein